MRFRLLLPVILCSLILTNNTFPQLAQTSWSFGIGGSYPRYISSGLTPKESNYGIYVSFQRHFSEHIGIRLLGNFSHMEGTLNKTTQETNLISENLDMLLYIVPCEPVSPYILFGMGGLFYKFNQKLDPALENKFYSSYQLNLGLGIEWSLGSDWKLQTELNYHSTGTGKLDGTYNNDSNGLLGAGDDAYGSLKAGITYYFSKGEPSRLCDLYNGITPKVPEVDYDRIESIIKKYMEKPSEGVDYNRIEDIVRRNQQTAAAPEKNKWVLIGVNFAPNSANFKTEAYPILFHAAQVLLENPELKVEIQGYTDDQGSDTYNLSLSLKRANAVKDYLVTHGVPDGRLTTVGFGSQNPVGDNRTPGGRTLNRRIEFKVLN